MTAGNREIVLHCGSLFGTPHGPHEWRWRRVSLPTDATGETTPYRWCPGWDAPCEFAGCPACGRHYAPHQETGEAHHGEPIECCASGRCEVCDPTFSWEA